jgi:hypothetical protein
MAGLIESVRLLLEKGADVNAQGGYYGNALRLVKPRTTSGKHKIAILTKI